MTVAGWDRDLPAGLRAEELNLAAKGSRPIAWAHVWANSPSSPILSRGPDGWITAGELEEATRRVAGRLQGAGLQPGDRMLFSAESSLELVVAHVAALRAGLVVVPANTAYGERELGHIVNNARPRAALVDDARRAR